MTGGRGLRYSLKQFPPTELIVVVCPCLPHWGGGCGGGAYNFRIIYNLQHNSHLATVTFTVSQPARSQQIQSRAESYEYWYHHGTMVILHHHYHHHTTTTSIHPQHHLSCRYILWNKSDERCYVKLTFFARVVKYTISTAMLPNFNICPKKLTKNPPFVFNQ